MKNICKFMILSSLVALLCLGEALIARSQHRDDNEQSAKTSKKSKKSKSKSKKSRSKKQKSSEPEKTDKAKRIEESDVEQQEGSLTIVDESDVVVIQ